MARALAAIEVEPGAPAAWRLLQLTVAASEIPLALRLGRFRILVVELRIPVGTAAFGR